MYRNEMRIVDMSNFGVNTIKMYTSIKFSVNE